MQSRTGNDLKSIVMNLGLVYLQAVGIMFVAFIGIPAAIEFFWRWKTGKAWRAFVFVILVFFIAMLLPTKYAVHQKLFAWIHERQNIYVPQSGRLTYEPQPTRLFATYRMDRDGFEGWVQNHPWQLKPIHSPFPPDLERFGIESPEQSFVSPSGENGKHLCVYFKESIMYLAYYAN